MLRKMTIGCVVVVAMLAARATLPAQSMGGMHSMGGMASRPGACIRSVIARTSHDTASLTFITSGTTSYTPGRQQDLPILASLRDCSRDWSPRTELAGRATKSAAGAACHGSG